MDVKEFEPVESENIISTPRKVELLVELEARGFRSDKRVQAKVTWVTESNYLEQQLNVQVVRVENYDIPKFKLMLNTMLRCLVTIESLSHYVRPTEVFGKVDLLRGRDSFIEKVVKAKVWEMCSSAWTSELMQEDVEHYLDNDYLLTVTPSVFNYGAEVQLPSINLVAQKYITNVLDVIKMFWYNHLKIGIPENISQNKIILFGQYSSKLEKVSVIIKTPREADFLLDIPLISPLKPYSLASLHDISPLKLYTNFSRLDIEQLELPVFSTIMYHRSD